MVAHRTIPGPAGYDGADTDYDLRLYLVADKSNAIAMILTSLESYYWQLAWNPSGAIELLANNALQRQGFKIARVWVAADYRRQGIMNWLVPVTANHLGVEIAQLGWELPFTDSGAALVRKVSPSTFLGSCDGFTLREVLSETKD